MWPEGGTSPFRGDKGTTWEGGLRVPFVMRWPGAPAGRVSSDIVDMTDLLPTLAAAAGETGVVEKLKKGAPIGGRNFKLHLDGVDQTALVHGQERAVARSHIFYYDETVLTAIRYKQFKVTFSAKQGGHWDDPLLSLGRPMVTNLRMDPFERQWGNVNRNTQSTRAGSDADRLAMQHLRSALDAHVPFRGRRRPAAGRPRRRRRHVAHHAGRQRHAGGPAADVARRVRQADVHQLPGRRLGQGPHGGRGRRQSERGCQHARARRGLRFRADGPRWRALQRRRVPALHLAVHLRQLRRRWAASGSRTTCPASAT